MQQINFFAIVKIVDDCLSACLLHNIVVCAFTTLKVILSSATTQKVGLRISNYMVVVRRIGNGGDFIVTSWLDAVWTG